MTRIANLLFAVTLAWIFSVLVTYFFVAEAGNGGEYWGFDGRTEAYLQAGIEFDRKNYLLLDVDITDHLGVRINAPAERLVCRSDSDSIETHSETNSTELLHGSDSARLASEYAYEFNRHMFFILSGMFGYSCVSE